MNGKNIFVTGAAGFIGARLSEMLLDRGYNVTGIDNLNDTYDPEMKRYRLSAIEKRANFRFLYGDITDLPLLETYFAANQTDAIINLAGIPGVRRSVENPWIFLDSNMKGNVNLLESARKYSVPKFIQASTSSVYGAEAPYPTPETADTNHPLQPYAVTKKGAEMMAYAYHYLYGIDVTVFRFFTVYGPKGRPDMAIFRFVKWISEGMPLRLNGDGRQTRGFTFVDDIAAGTILGLEPVGYQVFNLGGHESISMNALIARLEALIGKRAVIERGPSERADMAANLADISKARRELGWEPEVDLDEGLKRTVDWYLREREILKHIRV